MSRKDLLNRIFDHLDSDKNGVVTLNEMMKTAEHLNAAEVTAITHEFDGIDRDGNKALDRGEYVKAMQRSTKNISDGEFRDWAKMMLKSKDYSTAQLRKHGVEVHPRSFTGIGDDAGQLGTTAKMGKQQQQQRRDGQSKTDRLAQVTD